MQVGRIFRNRLWLIVGLVLTLVLAAVLVVVAITRLQQGAEDPTSDTPAFTGELPISRQRVVQDVLMVEVKRASGEGFGIDIVSVEHGEKVPNSDFVRGGAEGQPYSTLLVLDAEDNILGAQEFSIATTAVLEGFDTDLQQVAVADSAMDLVVPVPSGGAVKVEVVTSNGDVLDSKPVPQKPLSQKIELPKVKTVQAQEEDPDDVLEIAVINGLGAGGARAQAVASIENMLNTYEPWKQFAEKVKVTEVNNQNTNLGCQLGRAGALGNLPICPNTGRIANRVLQDAPNADTVVTVVDFPCDCGSNTAFGNNVLTVGSNPSMEIIMHELGHSMASMADEYSYSLGATTQSGPNCFASQNQCQEALRQAGGTGQCKAGCNSANSFRPATQLMHDVRAPFGPVERDIMKQAILGFVSEPGDNTEDDPDEPVPMGPLSVNLEFVNSEVPEECRAHNSCLASRRTYVATPMLMEVTGAAECELNWDNDLSDGFDRSRNARTSISPSLSGFTGYFVHRGSYTLTCRNEDGDEESATVEVLPGRGLFPECECYLPTPSPAPTPLPSFSPSPVPTFFFPPPPTFSPTPTPFATVTPIVTATPIVTPTPSPTPTPTFEPQPNPTPEDFYGSTR